MNRLRFVLFALAISTVLRTDVYAAGKPAQKEAPVSAMEDLMREHGELSRLLLIYEELSWRMENGRDYPSEALSGSTRIIRNFIQNYHEKLEEVYLFDRFRQANKLVELVAVLDSQHKAGRRIIDAIMAKEQMRKPEDKEGLARLMRSFIRMYRPHKAREDTELFPAFHSLVSPEEYSELGEDFEAEEERLFGGYGFEKTVARIEEIERSLGIYSLAQFTS